MPRSWWTAPAAPMRPPSTPRVGSVSRSHRCACLSPTVLSRGQCEVTAAVADSVRVRTWSRLDDLHPASHKRGDHSGQGRDKGCGSGGASSINSPRQLQLLSLSTGSLRGHCSFCNAHSRTRRQHAVTLVGAAGGGLERCESTRLSSSLPPSPYSRQLESVAPTPTPQAPDAAASRTVSRT